MITNLEFPVEQAVAYPWTFMKLNFQIFLYFSWRMNTGGVHNEYRKTLFCKRSYCAFLFLTCALSEKFYLNWKRRPRRNGRLGLFVRADAWELRIELALKNPAESAILITSDLFLDETISFAHVNYLKLQNKKWDSKRILNNEFEVV